MTQPQPLIPSAADAPTLTLAAATLLASLHPSHLTPDQAHALGVQAVDEVFRLWEEIQQRILAGILLRNPEDPVHVLLPITTPVAQNTPETPA